MFARGIPVVSAKLIVAGYKVYHLTVGDTVTDLTVQAAVEYQDPVKYTGVIAGFSMIRAGADHNDHAKVLDNIPMHDYQNPVCAQVEDASQVFEIDYMLLKINQGGVDQLVRVPAGQILDIAGNEPDETIKEIRKVVVVGEDGITPVEVPAPGQRLTANIICSDKMIGSYPADPAAHYTWFDQENPEVALGEEAVFTYTTDLTGRVIGVKVTVDEYTGEASVILGKEGNPIWPNSDNVEYVM